MNQEILNDYFSTHWNPKVDEFIYTGWSLISKVKPDETVIDVGCGYNLFKNKIPNLIGIDPANDHADFKVSIEDFVTEDKFDVAFCLGSINFGKKENILAQIEKVVSLLKPTSRIYWRSNPGLRDHGNEGCAWIDFYPWTMELHMEYSRMFGFDCPTLLWDIPNRIYAEWVRPQQSNI